MSNAQLTFEEAVGVSDEESSKDVLEATDWVKGHVDSSTCLISKIILV